MSYKEILQANNGGLRAISSDIDDLPDAEGRSAFPPEVSTEAEMDAILSVATYKDIGAVYKYTGNSGKYTRGILYIIEEVR